MAVRLVNIDDRLIHGQVATTWIKDYGIESVIIVNDAVANDPIQKSVAGLAVPGIKVSIFGVDQFLDVLKKTTIKDVYKRQPLLRKNTHSSFYTNGSF